VPVAWLFRNQFPGWLLLLVLFSYYIFPAAGPARFIPEQEGLRGNSGCFVFCSAKMSRAGKIDVTESAIIVAKNKHSQNSQQYDIRKKCLLILPKNRC
jgi:hypothetical protein